MSAPPYMKLYVADYLADTGHLTTREHGAYLLLLMAMWRAGGRLPSTDAWLADLTKCTAREWASIKPAILPFFRVSRGWLTSKRLGEELSKYQSKVGKLKEAGKKGSNARYGKDEGSGAANARKKSSKSHHKQNHIAREEGSNKPSSSYTRERTEEQPDGSSASRAAEVVDLDALRQKIASGAFD